ncbi:MAG: hypothetical protein WB615_00390 [Candidatus Tumulicola sp.]
MKRIAGLLLGSMFLFGGLSIVAAQDNADGAMPPPKVLVIYREFLKPGRAGTVHEKSERAFVEAFTKAKWPTRYIAADSQSGKPRTLFLVGYDSFDAWEKDNKAIAKNTALSSTFDRASMTDGDLQSDADAGIFTLSDEYSLRSSVDIAHMRYFEISGYQIRPGHHKDWDDAVKLVKEAYEKVPGAHWATYERVFGGGTTYLVFTPLKFASEIDQESDQNKQFVAAMGEEGMAKLRELEASGIESTQTNLFMFNPRMSYPRDEWIKADPDFWKSKAGMTGAMHKKPAEKQPDAQ